MKRQSQTDLSIKCGSPAEEDKNYNTALRWATMGGHVETVQVLAQAMKPEKIRVQLRGKNCFELAQEEYARTKNEKFKQFMDCLQQYQV